MQAPGLLAAGPCSEGEPPDLHLALSATSLQPTSAAAETADAPGNRTRHPLGDLQPELLPVALAPPPAGGSTAYVQHMAPTATMKEPQGLHSSHSNSSSVSRSPPPRSITSSSLSSSSSTARGTAATFGTDTTLPARSSGSPLQPPLPSCEQLTSSEHAQQQQYDAARAGQQQQAQQVPLRPYNWPLEKRGRSVFFARVPPAVGEEELAGLFGSAGRVEEVHLFKAFPRCRLSKGCGVVVYAAAAEADAARRTLHGRSLWSSSRNPLVVDPVKAADQVLPEPPADGADVSPASRGPASVKQVAAGAALSRPGSVASTSSSGMGRAYGDAAGPWPYTKLRQGHMPAGPRPRLQQLGVAGRGGLSVVPCVATGASMGSFLSPRAAAVAAGGAGQAQGQLASMMHAPSPTGPQQLRQGLPAAVPAPGAAPAAGPILGSPYGTAAQAIPGAAATYMYAVGPDGAMQLVAVRPNGLPAAAGNVVVYGAGGAALNLARYDAPAPPAAALPPAGQDGFWVPASSGAVAGGGGAAAYGLVPVPAGGTGQPAGLGVEQQATLRVQGPWAGPQVSLAAASGGLPEGFLMQSVLPPSMLSAPWQQQQQQQFVLAQHQPLVAQQQQEAWHQQQQQQQFMLAQQQPLVAAQQQQQQHLLLLVSQAQEAGAAASSMCLPAAVHYCSPHQQPQQQQLVGMDGFLQLPAPPVAGYSYGPALPGLQQQQQQMRLVVGWGPMGVGDHVVCMPEMPLHT